MKQSTKQSILQLIVAALLAIIVLAMGIGSCSLAHADEPTIMDMLVSIHSDGTLVEAPNSFFEGE